MALYRVASPFSSGVWQWVSSVGSTLVYMHNFCKYNQYNYPDAIMFGTTTNDYTMLQTQLANYLQGKPSTHISMRDFIATMKFDVGAIETSAGSWVLKECEQYLELIQRNPFHERDEERIKRRLEFMKFLVTTGKISETRIDTQSST